MKKLILFSILICLAELAFGQPLPPPKPVPLDGGLSLLLAAGGALGYRTYKKHKSKSEQDSDTSDDI